MKETLTNVYSGKRIFVTGHTGFKGAWLIEIFHQLGADVMGYALEPENEFDLFHVIQGASKCKSIIGDLRDKEKLVNHIIDFQPDYIFHLAAQPLVRLSYQFPSDTFAVNAVGTAHLLDAVRLLQKACNVVLITTDKVYHNNEWVYPYRENDRLGGYDPYSASKACAELVIDSYRNSFFHTSKYHIHQKSIAVARAGNVIGGGDWAKDRLIPDIVRAFSKNEEVVIRNPSSVRPWQHVLEPLSGYLLLGAKMALNPVHFGAAYNFGPSLADALSVRSMLSLSVQEWGGGEYRFEQEPNQLHEAGLLKLDTSKAASELSWFPRYNAATAIAKTMGWYKTYLENAGAAAEYTGKQVTEFLV